MIFLVKIDSVEEGIPPTVDRFEKLPFISVHEKYSFLEHSADFQFNTLLQSKITEDFRAPRRTFQIWSRLGVVVPSMSPVCRFFEVF